MGRKNDIFDDIFEVAAGALKAVGEIESNVIRRELERERDREIEIEAKKRIIEEERERESLEKMSDKLSEAYIEQFNDEVYDRDRLTLAKALVKSRTKMDELTLLEIARTFSYSSARSEFMREYYPNLKQTRY
jgi:hypothetical protein